MFSKLRLLNPDFIDKLPQTRFRSSQTLLPRSTRSRACRLQHTAPETETTGYVGSWRQDQIASSNGKLTLESLRVILTAQVSVSDILEISSSDYRIDVLEIKQGYFVLGVNPL